jgi:deoxyribonuclease-1
MHNRKLNLLNYGRTFNTIIYQVKKCILIILACASLAFTDYCYAQFSSSYITFDTTYTSSQGNVTYYFKNPFGYSLYVNTAGSLTQFFSVTPESFTVNPNDSFPVNITFSSNQNLTYRDFLFFNIDGINYPVINFLTATAKYTDGIYNFTQGLIDEELKTALKNFTGAGYISLGYNLARDGMFETIDDYGGDTIECVYTGRKIYAQDRTQAQNQGFNTEHTYPQSLFSQNEPMRSDIHHLFPTDENANSVRANLNFGVAVSNISWQVGGSRKGNDSQGQVIFEPRDVHKGNTARCLFYFTVRYNGAGIGNFVTQKQENVLRMWNSQYPVSEKESIRNNRIQSFQNNRNPFVDHPEFTERIKSFYTTSPTIPKGEIAVTSQDINFDTVAVNDTASFYLGVMNYGSGNLSTIISSDNTAFVIESSPSLVPAYNYELVKIKFSPAVANQYYTGTLTIINPDSLISISLSGYSSKDVGITFNGNEMPREYKLHQNYPNPFNPVTIIKFDIPFTPAGKFSDVKLSVINSLGKEILVIAEKKLPAGSYSYSIDSSPLPAGIYFYKLQAGNYTETKKMILLK